MGKTVISKAVCSLEISIKQRSLEVTCTPRRGPKSSAGEGGGNYLSCLYLKLHPVISALCVFYTIYAVLSQSIVLAVQMINPIFPVEVYFLLMPGPIGVFLLGELPHGHLEA